MSKVLGSELEHALDELFATSPDAFLTKRDALAKDRKAAGDAAGAKTITAQRKPTQTAHVLNALARQHGEDLAALIDVGRELARAQRKAIRGEGGAQDVLRHAIDKQRTLVGKLTAAASALGAKDLEEVASALRSGLVDPAIGEALEAGHLSKAPTTAAGFPAVTMDEVAAEEPAPRKTKIKTKTKTKTDTKAQKAKAAKEAKAAAAKAAEEAKAAKAEAARKAKAAAAAEAEREADAHIARANQLRKKAAELEATMKKLKQEIAATRREEKTERAAAKGRASVS